MIKYQNKSGKSGILNYETGETYILVEFRSGEIIYRYTYESAGKENVEEMKRLANIGEGLNSYIMRYCRTLYEKDPKTNLPINWRKN